MSTLVSFKNLLIKFKRIIADRLQNVFVLGRVGNTESFLKATWL